jgi:hypothetical protein
VDYDELTTLQDYLGSLLEPDIEPTQVTPYTDVFDMLSAQTAAALFDINDTTSLTTYRNGRITKPVEGDPVGQMMSVAGTNGDNVSSAQKITLATLADFSGGSGPDNNEWTQTSIYIGGTAVSLGDASGHYKITADIEVLNGADWSLYFRSTPAFVVDETSEYNNVKFSAGRHTISVERFYDSRGDIFCRLEPRSATNFGTVRIYSVTIEHVSGYVATAPSDAARPILASVLDETASELTDDGTRGEELVTNGAFSGSLDVSTTVSQNIGTVASEVYEVSYDITAFAGAGNTRLSLGTSGLGEARTSIGSYTETIRPDGNNPQTVYAFISVGTTATFENISVRKVQTVFDERGDELIRNGDFSDGGSLWAASAQSEIANGVASVISTDGSYQFIAQSISVEAGKAYQVSLDLLAVNAGSARITLTSAASGTFSLGSTIGPKSITFVAVSTGSANIYFDRAGGVTDYDIDNISVKEVLTPNLLLTSAGDDDSTFDSDTGNWNKGTGWTISGGTASHTGSAGSFQQSALVEQFKWYLLKVYVPAISGGSLFVRIGDPNLNDLTISTTGWHQVYAQADGTYLNFFASTGVTVDIDNVIIQEVPESVARQYYLDFDGTDDNMILDGTDFGSSPNATLYKTFRGDSTDTSQIMFGTNGGPYILTADSGSGGTTLNAAVGSPVYREDGTIPSYGTRNSVFIALIDDTDHTIGVEEADLSANGAWVSSGFYIGREYDATWASTGRLYAWAAVDTRLDGRNRDLLENYMISKKT